MKAILHIISMCVICENNIPSNITELFIWGCTQVTSIPNIPGLKKLDCDHCTNLTNIFPINGLIKLQCSYCPNLISIPIIPSLQELFCRSCLLITNIPKIDNIQRLYCDSNNINEIPNITELCILNCDDCPNIKVIHDNQKLSVLYCAGCTKLQSIPNTPTLTQIYCERCPMLIENYRIEIKECSDSPWISGLPGYAERISKLVFLQRKIRSYLRYLTFLRWIKSQSFAEWFYDPNNLGGRVDRRRFLKFINTLK